MTDWDNRKDFDAELDRTLAALTATDHIEARARARVLASLDRDRRSSAWLAFWRPQALAAGAAVLVAVAAGTLWMRSSPGDATPPAPLAAVRPIGPSAPAAVPVTGVRNREVTATAVTPVRTARRIRPWSSWEGDLPPLVVPPLQQPESIAAERLKIDEVTVPPIEIGEIEIEAVDASPSPAPHP